MPGFWNKALLFVESIDTLNEQDFQHRKKTGRFYVRRKFHNNDRKINNVYL